MYNLRRHLLGHMSILYAGLPDATLFYENCVDSLTFHLKMSPNHYRFVALWEMY